MARLIVAEGRQENHFHQDLKVPYAHTWHSPFVLGEGVKDVMMCSNVVVPCPASSCCSPLVIVFIPQPSARPCSPTFCLVLSSLPVYSVLVPASSLGPRLPILTSNAPSRPVTLASFSLAFRHSLKSRCLAMCYAFKVMLWIMWRSKVFLFFFFSFFFVVVVVVVPFMPWPLKRRVREGDE